MNPPEPPPSSTDPLASLYRQLFDAMPVELALLDPEGRFLYLNQSAVRDPEVRSWLIGRTEEEYCTFRGLDQSLATRRKSYRNRARDEARAVSFEETMDSEDGRRHVLRTIVPILGDGEVTHFAGFGLDITERKGIEDAVRKSEEKYRSLFEQTQDVVYISTPDGRLLDMNQAGLDLLGFQNKRELEDHRPGPRPVLRPLGTGTDAPALGAARIRQGLQGPAEDPEARGAPDRSDGHGHPRP